MQEIPSWVLYAVGIANIIQIFSALAIIALGVVGVGILLQIKGIISEEVRRDILPSVSGTLKNVEKISTDAADTTHNVTATANRVSNLVGSAVNRLESPLIRAVGLASGVLAASRSVRGGKKTDNRKNGGVSLGKTIYSNGYDGAPEKIVIIAGPSFGQAIRFMIFGAAIGAAAIHFLAKPRETIAPAPRFDPLKSGKAALFSLIKSKIWPTKPAPTGSTADLLQAEAQKTESLKAVGAKYEAAVEDFSADAKFEAASSPIPSPTAIPADVSEDLAARIGNLTSRLKVLGARAKDLVETAGEAVKPTLETALAEGKRAAAEVQSKLKKDVDEAGTRPAIFEQDGELPSEKEDKFIE